MTLKIFVLDDDLIKREYFKVFIKESCLFSHHIENVENYKSARLYLGNRFDLLIVDYDLRDEKTGLDFIVEYQSQWPESICFLYSAESERINREVAKTIKCLSLKELELELIQAFAIFEQQPMSESFKMSGQTMVMPIANGFNKELCDERHERDKDEHESFKASVSEVKNEIKGIAQTFKEEMIETRKQVRDDNKTTNRMMLFLLLGLLANVATKFF